MLQLLVVLSVFCFLTASTTKDKVLVLLDTFATKDSHSQYFSTVEGLGYQLDFRLADDASLSLSSFGEYLYKNVIVFAPSVREFGGKINVAAFLKYIDDGGNVLVASGSRIGEAIRELAAECGVEFDEEGTAVIDHFNYDKKDAGNHTLVVVRTENLSKAKPIVGNVQDSVFLYRGTGLSADSENPLLVNILHADSTAYSYKPLKVIQEYPNTVGQATQLITALQARNNARVLFCGSLDFFSDEFFSTAVQNVPLGKKFAKSANRELAKALTLWTFHRSGVLRVANVTHYKHGENYSRGEYTITDNVHYEIEVEELNEGGVWKPYLGSDMQMEFVRIDPFIRKTLRKGKGTSFFADFKLPDVYGVYKFVVDYSRIGYTNLLSSTQVSVRPLTHTQYERFIEAAYPYYANVFSMMIGVVIFSFLFLYYKPEHEHKD